MTAPGAASTDPVRASRSGPASASWRDVVRAASVDPGFAWALGLGVVLIALGLLGFVPNPLVGAPSPQWGSPLLVTGDSHDVVHLVGGAIALHAALGMSRPRRDIVLITLGAVSLLLLAVGILDGRWFGLVPWPVSLADQLLHLVAGLGSILVGLAGRGAFEMGGTPAASDAIGSAATTAGASPAAAAPVGVSELADDAGGSSPRAASDEPTSAEPTAESAASTPGSTTGSDEAPDAPDPSTNVARSTPDRDDLAGG